MHTMDCYSCKEKLNHEICRWVSGARKCYIYCGNSDPEKQIPDICSQFVFLAPVLHMLVYNLKQLQKLETLKRGHIGWEGGLEMGVGEYRQYGMENGGNLGI